MVDARHFDYRFSRIAGRDHVDALFSVQLGVLCVFVVNYLFSKNHHRDTKSTEIAQRNRNQGNIEPSLNLTLKAAKFLNRQAISLPFVNRLSSARKS